MRMPLKDKQLYTKPLCRSFDMENSLLAEPSIKGDGEDAGWGGGDSQDPAKDFDFSQEGGAWEEAKRYNSSLVDD